MTSVVEKKIRAVMTQGAMALASFNRSRLGRPGGGDPFLQGIHAPMQAELDLASLPVEGSLPPELRGRYLRIGPNPIDPDPRGHHWFTGDGMVHGLRLEAGAAPWYRNRWVRSRSVAQALGEAPAPGPHRALDTVNTAVIAHAGATYAIVEAGSVPVRLRDDLGQQAYDDFGGTLAGAFSAHPHADPRTGELHAICYEGQRPDHVTHVVVDAAGRVTRELRVPMAHGPMVHDCALTARHVAILDLPVCFTMPALLGGHRFPYRWKADQPARVGLLPRAGDAESIVWIPIEPCFVFHTVNAWDRDDGRVVLDVVVYDRMFDGPVSGPDQAPRGLERWVLDPVARTCERRMLHAAPQEFPRIDERLAGQPNRYAYTVGLAAGGEAFVQAAGHVFKHDLDEGCHWRHDFGPGRIVGEFVFVPRSATADEDDGWLLGLVIDTQTDSTELAVLDARDIEAPPVARVRLPHRIPPGFHGAWIPD